jgi:hypothetical protein
MYNNPENLSREEIHTKLAYSISYHRGSNRAKRKQVLESYASDIITKEEWIAKYCVK